MIHIYVGCVESEELAYRVLKYSIEKNTTYETNITPLGESGIDIPVPADPKNRSRTTFSFQRFLIPQLMGYKGKAIYLDSDMILFRDIADLYSKDVDSVTCRTHDYDTSVILINCERSSWDIKKIVLDLDNQTTTYQKLFADLQTSGPTISSAWNAHDRLFDGNPHGYKKDQTFLLHYTTTKTQPWLARGHPLEDLWFKYLYEMLDLGIVSLEMLREAVEKLYLRPSILYQIEHRLLSSANLPLRQKQLDTGFVSPHGMKLLHQGRSRILNRIANNLYQFRNER